jgi:hypothetical protein
MIVTIPNRPPYFMDETTSFADIIVPMNSIKDLPIPAFKDPELQTVAYTLIQSSTPTVTASFSSISNLKINPTSFTEIGVHST